MALPAAYLTSSKNLPAILDAIQQAKAPERFTVRFLQSLEFKASSDRLVIGVLKALGFLDDQGKPTSRYFAYLDKDQAKAVMAEGIRLAYKDLFDVNINAQKLSKAELANKLKTLTQGQYGEAVIDKMSTTFTSLAKLADFEAARPQRTEGEEEESDELDDSGDEVIPEESDRSGERIRKARLPRLNVNGLHYNIQIILPESRDPAVYDALFRSLREHLG
ncbi:MAG: DUF5343 domain-containing protein [Sphingomicrobium sp.]